ncbi:transcriptional regulator [Gordoniibacillus kamchatkensis]|uniref:Transcriptional regulator n=1 Tax=Gordoniibacillus kamchatkensis TaxID=1590651 RepID=A0ABR5AMS9_9BACL|nr:YafY family protein [Paenibacillus sp. VKM B-2647]KIL42316.1 transcriptional regulator [Paenibacillus sp. VKM B-2647]
MNKTDRQMAIILELQRFGERRAEDLAATFETSVRTIYRDMQALSEAGVPVVGAPGQGYSLMEGYFLPPVSFTAEEATALLLGLDFIERQFDAGYRAEAQRARGKLEAILPGPVRLNVARVRSGVKLLAAGRPGAGEEEVLVALRRAILDERKVRFRYDKKVPEPDGNRRSVREADPYGLVLTEGVWMLVAFCHLRQGMRHFRLSRMSDVEVLDERFRRPEHFDLHAYKPANDRTVTVRVRIAPELADRALEKNYYYTEASERTPEGLLLTLKVRHPFEVLGWVLGWGAGAVVLEPEELRERVRQEWLKGLKSY